MTATLDSTSFAIRSAISSALRGGIRGLQAQPYVMQNPTPPSADVRRGQVDYDQALQGGVTHWIFMVRVYIAGTSDKGAQANLDAYLSPEGDRSVKQAIESDTSLGGLVADLHVTTASGEQIYQLANGAEVVGSDWTVEVWLQD